MIINKFVIFTNFAMVSMEKIKKNIYSACWKLKKLKIGGPKLIFWYNTSFTVSCENI